jgi:hypothetical protein
VPRYKVFGSSLNIVQSLTDLSNASLKTTHIVFLSELFFPHNLEDQSYLESLSCLRRYTSSSRYNSFGNKDVFHMNFLYSSAKTIYTTVYNTLQFLTTLKGKMNLAIRNCSLLRKGIY